MYFLKKIENKNENKNKYELTIVRLLGSGRSFVQLRSYIGKQKRNNKRRIIKKRKQK